MDDAMIETRLENIEQRLTRVERFLPTLATKDELSASVALLATREELRAAIAPLATKEELREEFERSRQHMVVLIEAQRGDVQMLAEHLSVVMSRFK